MHRKKMKRVRGIYILDETLEFPDPSEAVEDGFLAAGGDFSTERLLLAYRSGIFPWTENPITWWSPDPRGIIPLDDFHISRRLDRIIRQNKFTITYDKAFEKVILGCTLPTEGRGETWITESFIEAYIELHQKGHAHSIECWYGDKLAGGLYGVAIGGFFAGESMFHTETNGSSIALAILLRALKEAGYTLFDTQMVTHHTERFGAIEIPRKDYLAQLRRAIRLECPFPTAYRSAC